MPPLLVLGICGGSGSGKTTIATKLLSGFQERNKKVGLIAMDSYYCDLSHMSLKERSAWNFDHPKAFETSLLVKHIQSLKDGDAINIPVYDFQQHLRTKQTVKMAAPEILIIEGILLFADPELQRMVDIKIFVDASPDVRLVRRLRRDVVERGRSVDQVCNQYLQTVREMHEEYVEPCKDSAHIVVPNNGYKGMGEWWAASVSLEGDRVVD